MSKGRQSAPDAATRCPSWVKTGSIEASRRRLLYPQERTSSAPSAMSVRAGTRLGSSTECACQRTRNARERDDVSFKLRWHDHNILTVSNEGTARLFAVGRSLPLCYCDRASSAPSDTSPSGQIPTSPTGRSEVRKRPRASLHPDRRRMPHIRAGRNSLPERPRPLRRPRGWRRERAFDSVLKQGDVIVPATTDTAGLVRKVIPIAKIGFRVRPQELAPHK